MKIDDRYTTQAEINRNIVEIIERQKPRIKSMEHLAGESLNIPNKISNSSPRLILQHAQSNQRLELYSPETPTVGAGFETQIGENSSSFIRTDNPLQVIAKISKYKYAPNHHYYLIVRNMDTGIYDVIERVSYKHNIESYGFLYNNTYLDALKPSYIIPKGIAIKKSNSYDEYNNRQDGANINVTYMCMEETKEDPVIISDYAAEKLAAPLITNVSEVINENNLPLNIYGDANTYKPIPDIGEKVANGVVLAIRTEKRKEFFYAQSNESLRKIMMSDTRYSAKGEVVEINVYCNNPAMLESNYMYEQFKYYYQQQMDFYKEFINAVETYTDINLQSYHLEKMLTEYKAIVDGTPFLKETPFSNILVEIVTIDMNPVRKGDKITNRFGGKGVVSEIRPRKMMPKTIVNGEVIYADAIYNSNTCVNRENPGQLFETSTTFIGKNIANKILKGCSLDDATEMYSTFLRIIAPGLYKYLKKQLETDSVSTMIQVLESIKKDGKINVSQLPLSETLSIDKVAEIYRALPWIEQYKVIVPQRDSNNNIRYIYARRRMVISEQYIYRLEQHAESKFSVVSLGTTNIKNENSRNNLKKTHRSPYSKTSVKVLGEMETMDLLHIGAEQVITVLMLHSASPIARKLTQKLLVDDPFEVDVRLNEDAKNRSVEIVNTYFRAIGLRLRFSKIKKEFKTFMVREQKFITRIPENKTKPFKNIMTRVKENERINIMQRVGKKK